MNTVARRKVISTLTCEEIKVYCRRLGYPLGRHECLLNKPALVKHVLDVSPAMVIDSLIKYASEKRGRSDAETRRAVEAITHRRNPCMQFMQLPTAVEVKACYREYYLATSNAALASGVCAVCGQETKVEDLHRGPISNIPNNQRLIPRAAHFGHDLYDGRLLEPQGILTQGSSSEALVCTTCLADLQGPRDHPPKYSLANGLWIGRVPWELEVLTFPEQLLISLLYPRVYVFRLFPKSAGGGRDTSTLQRAMRGTVSSYQMNTDAVASMIRGDLMPRPPSILASLVSITYIGKTQPRLENLKGTFRVRRRSVQNALVWLKENNPKYYGSIDVSVTRLLSLPEDDIPPELVSIIRHSTDVGALEDEGSGYVPNHEEQEDVPDGTFSVKGHKGIC
jgi:hypothetical protein